MHCEMVRAASRVADNADKIRTLARGGGRDRDEAGTRRSRPPSRQDFVGSDNAQGERRAAPLDILSDGYDSGGDTGSEQVLALLRSGVNARQTMDLGNAKSAFSRASQLQSNRKGKPKNKYTVWLRGVAARLGKEEVRKAARDIQRCYRGMLGREDAAWHRLQRKKKLKAQQAALDAQRRREATALLQRCYRGHRGRLQAGWRRRMRAEREESCRVLQASVRRHGGRVHLKALLEESARAQAATLLQARCTACLVRVRLEQKRSDAARCLQRTARWALCRTQLAALLHQRAAAILAAAAARALARHLLADLRQEQLERIEAEAKREAERRELARQAAASTAILCAWRQRSARRATVRALAARHSAAASFTDAATPAPETSAGMGAPGYLQSTRSHDLKRSDLAPTMAMPAAAPSLPPTPAPPSAQRTPCAILAALATEACSIADAPSPDISPARLARLLATCATLTQRAAAATRICDAWQRRRARLRAALAVCDARRAAETQQRRHASALRLQAAWQRHILLRAARRRAAAAAAAAGQGKGREYGEAEKAAATRVGLCVRGWLARRELRRRQGACWEERTGARRQCACIVLQTSWRAHASRREVHEEREWQDRERREWAVARVGGIVCSWWARRGAREEAEIAARIRLTAAAARIQAVVIGHQSRSVVRALGQAVRQRDQLLREGAAGRVWGAWQCAVARRQLAVARRQRKDAMAKQLALEMVREERAVCVLQTGVRRLWAHWTMAFYIKQTMRLQCGVRSWRARRTLEALRQRRRQERRAAAAERVQWWWREERRRREKERARALRERAAAFQRQLREQEEAAQQRERALVAATYRMIATVKGRAARSHYVQQRCGAILLECAWRGCKARDALMWKCLRRKQRDEYLRARTHATTLLSAHLLRLTAARRLHALRSAHTRLAAATSACALRRQFVDQRAAGRRLGAAVGARGARGLWVWARGAVAFLEQALQRYVFGVLRKAEGRREGGRERKRGRGGEGRGRGRGRKKER